jgi:hypothetical protein
MSAALALDFSGPRVPCSFPRCTLDAFHDGDHVFPRQQPRLVRPAAYHCVVCGTPFDVYGAEGAPVFETCGQPACIEHWAARHSWSAPVLCGCPQREYPHELSVHTELRGEASHPDRRYRWPWALMLSRRVEPSTERRPA